MKSKAYCHILLILIETVYNVHSKYHYPGSSTDGERNIMLCSPRFSIIDIRLRICVPLPDGGWQAESADNCVKLKAQCPEFNEAECVWQSITPCDDTNISLTFPTCRLKYYAAHDNWSTWRTGKRTWMEIHYANQFGTKVAPVYNYIVELHRYVNEEVADKFGVKPQGDDFPGSVFDQNEAGGISWITSLQPLLKTKENEAPICNGTDTNNLCKNLLNGGWQFFLDNIKNQATKDFFNPAKHKDNRTVTSASACGLEPYRDPNRGNEFYLEDVCVIQLRITIPYVPVTFNYITCKIRDKPSDDPARSDNFTFKQFSCYAWHDGWWDGNWQGIFTGQ